MTVRSADPSEAREVGTRVYHDHRLEVLGDKSTFAFRMDATALGPVTIGWLTYDTPVRIETAEFEDSYQVNLVAHGVMPARCGHEEIIGTPGVAMVYRPDRPTAFSGWQTPEPMLAIKIDRRTLERELERLLDRPVSQPIGFDLGLDIASSRGADWSRLVRATAAGLADQNSLLREPMVAAPLIHSLLSGLLLSARHELRDQLDAPGPSRVPGRSAALAPISKNTPASH